MLVATSIDNMVVGGPAYNCQVPLLPCFQPTRLQSTPPLQRSGNSRLQHTRIQHTHQFIRRPCLEIIEIEIQPPIHIEMISTATAWLKVDHCAVDDHFADSASPPSPPPLPARVEA